MSPNKDREMERGGRPTPVRRESLWRGIKNKFSSPGRGEISRGDVVHGREMRVRKQKSKEVIRQLARHRQYSVSDSGSDAENDDSELPVAQKSKSPRKTSGRMRHPESNDSQQQQQQQQQLLPSNEPHWLSKLFTFIGNHPTVPHILSFYAQLLFNVFLLAMFSYILWCFWSAIQGDVDKRAWEASADIIAEITQCAHDFQLNECGSDTRAPALKDFCNTWAKCKNRDPMKVARAKVSAQSFAEIFNSFVDALSWKAITVVGAFVLGGLLVSNVAFSKLRNVTSTQQPWAHPYAYQPPPPTPQTHRQFSGQEGGFYQSTPWQNAPGLEPAPSSNGYAQIEGRGSPVRRLVYN
jgi:hypothetical protein